MISDKTPRSIPPQSFSWFSLFRFIISYRALCYPTTIILMVPTTIKGDAHNKVLPTRYKEERDLYGWRCERKRKEGEKEQGKKEKEKEKSPPLVVFGQIILVPQFLIYLHQCYLEYYLKIKNG